MNIIKKNSDSQEANNKALKSAIWYTVSNFIVGATGFITTPIFTRMLSKTEIGLFSNITSWYSVIYSFTSLYLASSLVVAHFDYKNELDDFSGSVLLLSTINTIILFIIMIVFKRFFSSLLSIDYYYLCFMLCICLFNPAIDIVQHRSRANFEYKKYTLLSILSVILSAVFSAVFVFVFSNKLQGRIFGHYLPLLLIYIVLYVSIIVKTKKVKKEYFKYALSIGVPTTIHHLGGTILSVSDKMMITKMIGPEQNAIYSIGYLCASIINILLLSANLAWAPWQHNKVHNHESVELKRISKYYLMIFFVIVFMLLLIMPEIIYIIGGSIYKESLNIVVPVAVGYLFMLVYTLYINVEIYYKKNKYMALATAISALINIVLNYLYIPKYGYIAAAYTTLIGYISLFIMHALVVRLLKKNEFVDLKFNILFLFFSIILMPIFTILYNYYILRYILISVLLMILIIFIILNKKRLIVCLKNGSIESLVDLLLKHK